MRTVKKKPKNCLSGLAEAIKAVGVVRKGTQERKLIEITLDAAQATEVIRDREILAGCSAQSSSLMDDTQYVFTAATPTERSLIRRMGFSRGV